MIAIIGLLCALIGLIYSAIAFANIIRISKYYLNKSIISCIKWMLITLYPMSLVAGFSIVTYDYASRLI